MKKARAERLQAQTAAISKAADSSKPSIVSVANVEATPTPTTTSSPSSGSKAKPVTVTVTLGSILGGLQAKRGWITGLFV